MLATTASTRAAMRGLAVAFAAMLTLLVGLAQPANAAPTSGLTVTAAAPALLATIPDGCSSGSLCFWNGASYTDGPGKLSGRNTNWTAFSKSSCPRGTWNDCATSFFNAGVNCAAVIWINSGYSGHGLTLLRGQGVANMGSYAPIFNNEISSNSWSAPSGSGTSSACPGPAV